MSCQCHVMSCHVWLFLVLSGLFGNVMSGHFCVCVCVVNDGNELDYNDADVIVLFLRFCRCGFLFGHRMRIRR